MSNKKQTLLGKSNAGADGFQRLNFLYQVNWIDKGGQWEFRKDILLHVTNYYRHVLRWQIQFPIVHKLPLCMETALSVLERSCNLKCKHLSKC